MNLFKLNKDYAVKLNQSFETLYNLDYNEYSLLINIINDETEKENNKGDLFSEVNLPQSQLVNLPDHLKIK